MTTLSGVPNAPRTPHRTIRVPDALWNAAREKAEREGRTLSEVLREMLERYVSAGEDRQG